MPKFNNKESRSGLFIVNFVDILQFLLLLQ